MIVLIVATCEVLLLGLLVTGAFLDIILFRLPNWLTLGTALVALPWLLLSGPDVSSVLLHVLAGLLMLCVGMIAFRFHMLGGGDVKWLASLALWVGLNLDLARLLVLTTFFGGGLAIIVFVLGKFRPGYGVLDGKQHLPYGAAIAVAGVDFWLRHTHLGQDLWRIATS
jgi:prepilin peptidase CpaA